VFEKRLMRRTFLALIEVEKIYENCILKCYSSPDTIKVIKSRRIRWVGSCTIGSFSRRAQLNE
jgi:hypothetical protein